MTSWKYIFLKKLSGITHKSKQVYLKNINDHINRLLLIIITSSGNICLCFQIQQQVTKPSIFQCLQYKHICLKPHVRQLNLKCIDCKIHQIWHYSINEKITISKKYHKTFYRAHMKSSVYFMTSVPQPVAAGPLSKRRGAALLHCTLHTWLVVLMNTTILEWCLFLFFWDFISLYNPGCHVILCRPGCPWT